MKCKFRRYKHATKYKECTEECEYFETCTRNPHRKEVKQHGGTQDANKESNG